MRRAPLSRGAASRYRSGMTIDEGKRGKGATRAWRVAAGWSLLVGAILLWWAAHYAGWIARAGEWQFARWGSYFPALTLAVLALLLGVPAMLAARARARQRREPLDPLARMRAGVAWWRRLFGVATIAGAVTTLAVLASLPGLPDAGGAILLPNAAAPVPGEGLAELRGDWRTGRRARLEEDYVVARRTLWVAPVAFPGRGDTPVALLTTLVPDPDGRWVPVTRGILVRGGVPAELRHLYQAAGVTIARDAGLLMPDSAAVRWRTLMLAAQAALLTLLAAAGWAMLRAQARRVDHMIADADGRFAP